MARSTIPESIERKLEKAQGKLMRLKARYDAASAEVEMLLKRRDELKRKKLLEAFITSGRSYEEVLEFLRTGRRRSDDTEDTGDSEE